MPPAKAFDVRSMTWSVEMLPRNGESAPRSFDSGSWMDVTWPAPSQATPVQLQCRGSAPPRTAPSPDFPTLQPASTPSGSSATPFLNSSSASSCTDTAAPEPAAAADDNENSTATKTTAMQIVFCCTEKTDAAKRRPAQPTTTRLLSFPRVALSPWTNWTNCTGIENRALLGWLASLVSEQPARLKLELCQSPGVSKSNAGGGATNAVDLCALAHITHLPACGGETAAPEAVAINGSKSCMATT
uniref:Uncharacterized protein n=1 Tax=Oryza rufipogon TaxID=4529 RepID=A0A0E0PE53_ORYRU